MENPAKTVSPNRAYGHFMRFQKKRGLRRTSVRLLRRSFASLRLQGGGNLKQLQSVLGHSQAQTTLTYYAGIAESQNRAAVESVEKLIQGGGNMDKKPRIFWAKSLLQKIEHMFYNEIGRTLKIPSRGGGELWAKTL